MDLGYVLEIMSQSLLSYYIYPEACLSRNANTFITSPNLGGGIVELHFDCVQGWEFPKYSISHREAGQVCLVFEITQIHVH